MLHRKNSRRLQEEESNISIAFSCIATISVNKLTEKIFLKPLDILSAIIQLMAGGGVALIGTTLVPLLSGLFG